ncbi:MAG: pyruvate formate-lyase activating enzyme [Desulfobacteraceae bacterium]|nr:pyruvate formate-lyase activating enzyme [Desulfobacteraceae bacterium]
MSRFLLIDIGAGTMDVLYVDTTGQLHYKAVVISPVRDVAGLIERTPGNLMVDGVEMGGGPVSAALIERANTSVVIMSASAANTIHHEVERVKGHGIRILGDGPAAEHQINSGFTRLSIGDIQPGRIERLVRGFGVPFEFDAVAVCAQDHGVAPAGVSHLDFRHNIFTGILELSPYPESLLFDAESLPGTLNRLSSIDAAARRLPATNIYVMDSGMAAILGASMDISVRHKETIAVFDVATSHTVGAVLHRGALCGFFEYHTRDITVDGIYKAIHALADGTLSHQAILEQGGHGAYLRRAPGFDRIEAFVITGPRRRLLEDIPLPVTWGAPWGDNMMTGTVGLMEALRRRLDLDPMVYL